MNKSLGYVNLSLELHVVSTFWLRSDTSSTSSLHFAQPSYELEWPTLGSGRCSYLGAELILSVASCKLSAKLSLMLDNPFPVPSLCKLNHISFCFIQISMKITCKQLIPFRKSNAFWSHPRCFGALGKFQHNIKISVKTVRVSRLSFRFLWLWKYKDIRPRSMTWFYCLYC